jgi:hypothetical protein
VGLGNDMLARLADCRPAVVSLEWLSRNEILWMSTSWVEELVVCLETAGQVFATRVGDVPLKPAKEDTSFDNEEGYFRKTTRLKDPAMFFKNRPSHTSNPPQLQQTKPRPNLDITKLIIK